MEEFLVVFNDFFFCHSDTTQWLISMKSFTLTWLSASSLQRVISTDWPCSSKEMVLILVSFCPTWTYLTASSLKIKLTRNYRYSNEVQMIEWNEYMHSIFVIPVVQFVIFIRIICPWTVTMSHNNDAMASLVSWRKMWAWLRELPSQFCHLAHPRLLH